MPDDRDKDPEHPFSWWPWVGAQSVGDPADVSEHEETGAEAGAENIMPDPPEQPAHPPLPHAPHELE